MRYIGYFIIFLFIAALILMEIPLQAMAQTDTLLIEKDTIITVEIINHLSSRNAKAGDKVPFVTRKDVVVNGIVVIPNGTQAVGNIEKVQPAGRWGKGGYFRIGFGSLKSLNEVDVPVEIGKAAQGAQKRSGVILPIVSLVVFWPLVFFGLTKGKEAEIPAGQQLFVNVRNDTDLGITREQAIEIYKARIEEPDTVSFSSPFPQESDGNCNKKKSINDPVATTSISDKPEPLSEKTGKPTQSPNSIPTPKPLPRISNPPSASPSLNAIPSHQPSSDNGSSMSTTQISSSDTSSENYSFIDYSKVDFKNLKNGYYRQDWKNGIVALIKQQFSTTIKEDPQLTKEAKSLTFMKSQSVHKDTKTTWVDIIPSFITFENYKENFLKSSAPKIKALNHDYTLCGVAIKRSSKYHYVVIVLK